ncbi:hypothetical protein FQR65_LT16245 [Abscondita terminalis]|nr:hypothetical protein FQR65_LT16245 [Abscondita terminalis]
MRSVRRRCRPTVPNNLSRLGKILLEEPYGLQFTCHGERLCRQTVNNGHGTSLTIFCRHLVEEVLRHGVSEIHADGTCKTVPSQPQLRQMFIIHGILENHSVPLCFILMERSTKTAYVEVLEHFKNEVAPTLTSEIIISDYEAALQSAFWEVYPANIISMSSENIPTIINEILQSPQLRVAIEGCIQNTGCIQNPSSIPSPIRNNNSNEPEPLTDRRRGVNEELHRLFPTIRPRSSIHRLNPSPQFLSGKRNRTSSQQLITFSKEIILILDPNHYKSCTGRFKAKLYEKGKT